MSELYQALNRDAAENGFQHTEDEIISFLTGCTDDAVQSLYRSLGAHVRDIAQIRQQEAQRQRQ